MSILASTSSASTAAGWGGMIIWLVVLFGFMYFFMIRPQSKKQKELKRQRDAMKEGDRVVTAGGIHGKIRELRDNTVSVEIAPNVSIKVDRSSVYPLVEEQPKAKK